MHLGVILANFGERATPDAIRWTAEAAEELGFDSVWVTEHILVGREAATLSGRVYAPLVTLGWLAALTERVALGTSIVILPLHHPVHLAKEAATVHELSGGRLLLGVGLGWHEDEFGSLGVPFRRRGPRADEALAVMKALWRGERSFAGELWSFEDGTFGPLPDTEPQLWFGGSTDQTVRRVAAVKREHPALTTVPRTRLENVDAVLDAGADGVVVTLPDAAAMRDFVGRYR